AVTLLAVAHDVDLHRTLDAADRSQVEAAGASQIALVVVLPLRRDAALDEVRGGDQRGLDHRAGDVGDAVRRGAVARRVEALGEVVADDRARAGQVRGRVRGPEVA